MRMFSFLIVTAITGCGHNATKSPAREDRKAPVKAFEDKLPVAAEGASRPASMPRTILVRVKEGSNGEVLSGKENVEIRSLATPVDTLNKENVYQAFNVDGKPITIAENSDSLDGDSSDGQCYWGRGYYGGYYGSYYGGGYNNDYNDYDDYGSVSPYSYGGGYGYSNYSPFYSYSGYSYGYGYNNNYSCNGYRYYSYGW